MYNKEDLIFWTGIMRDHGNFQEMRQECRIMAIGTFTPLVPDHFIREQQYWIAKIKENIK